MDKVLYFPAISIPNNQWLTTSLLYWDKVASIVPKEYLDEPEKLDEYTRKLLEAELLEQLVPENHLWEIQNFEEEFLNFVDKSLELKDITTNYQKSLKYPKSIISTKEIHMSKLSGLGEELEKRRLAIKGTDNWYSVESDTASYFMTYLATVLGNLKNYTPVTDNYSDLIKFVTSQEDTSFRETLKENLRTKVLDGIFPIPTHIENPNEILHFKNDNEDQLKAFRRYIEDFVLKLERVPESQIEDEIKLFKENTQYEINRISSKMATYKWDSIDIVSFTAIGNAVYDSTQAILAGSNFDIGSTALGLLGAIAALRDKNSNLEAMEHHVAYAAIMKKKFNYKE